MDTNRNADPETRMDKGKPCAFHRSSNYSGITYHTNFRSLALSLHNSLHSLKSIEDKKQFTFKYRIVDLVKFETVVQYVKANVTY